MANVPRVAIVGGGLAGLAAAVGLMDRGVCVELFEARRKLGGRAGSYVERTSGELIDHCQHVAMGCCTNFLDFCRRTGVVELLARYERLHFLGPDGRRSDFCPARWLPPPLHLAGALLGLSYLSLADKLAIGRAMLRLMRLPEKEIEGGPTALAWLHGQRQSATAIERFWQVVLVSALGESLERASLAAAQKVFLDGFLRHRDASAIFVPRVSLGELYDVRVASWLRKRGAVIHCEQAIDSVLGDGRGVRGVRLAGDVERTFDFVIIAVPWRRVGDILPREMAAVVDRQARFGSIASAPISSVHLWFDRPITELPHAVLVGRLTQWVFARSIRSAGQVTDNPHPSPLPQGKGTGSGGHYYQVVISASHELAGRERQGVVEEVLGDLRAVFAPATEAKLLRWQLITEHEAVFSVQPGLDAIRPRQQTAIANLLLAGDWTATGWPATMEGAVRSGYLAAEAILSQLGRPERIVAPDLTRGWLVKWLER